MRIAILLAVVAVLPAVLATTGVDVSTRLTTSTWQCLKNSGKSFGVIRAYRSDGSVDPNAPATVADAWSGGMAHVDIYMFPCPHCSKSAATQVDEMANHMKNSRFGMVWLDIEGTQYWRDQNFNRNFFNQLLSQCQKHGFNVGVYSSASQWAPIMGSWTGGSSRPLWYAHYDGIPNFNDFKSFGGWTKPAIKQYLGDQTLCGAGVDLNWYP